MTPFPFRSIIIITFALIETDTHTTIDTNYGTELSITSIIIVD